MFEIPCLDLPVCQENHCSITSLQGFLLVHLFPEILSLSLDFRERGREKREKLPRQRMEPATLWCMGQSSTN